MNDKQLFIVRPKSSNINVLVWEYGRERAKEAAIPWLSREGWGGPDNWDVVPLTMPGDRVHIAGITLNV